MLELCFQTDQVTLLGTGFPATGVSDPLSPPPKCLSQRSRAHCMHLSVGSEPQKCLPSRILQPSESFSTSFFFS